MNYGLSMPNFGVDVSARGFAEQARAAEAAGWDGFFLWDHLLAFGPGPIAVVDPWVALTAAAMLTSRVRLGTLVTPLPRRRPTTLARQIASLDHLAGGRITLGVGMGLMPFEWDYLGEEPDMQVRGAQLDEALTVLTGLWTGAPFRHEGTHYRIAGAPPINQDWQALFYPPPVQARIPIWVAATLGKPGPLRRAARWDGNTGRRSGHRIRKGRRVCRSWNHLVDRRHSPLALRMDRRPVLAGRGDLGAHHQGATAPVTLLHSLPRRKQEVGSDNH
jgi:alkanesulfonate monooxygenase SsuD/methylene tetrahydromethanopterin reductase-like flavin-dependent oxidoreductase (luciferase family)